MAEAKTIKPFNMRRLLIFLAIGLVGVLVISGTISLMWIWNTILLNPVLNFLVLISKYSLGNFGIAIIVLTVIIRLLMYPLTMRQLKASKAMANLQPKMKELQKKYAKDQQKLNQEVMKLYKEEGVSPLGCALPMLVQFPIWIALYQSIIQALAYTPENLLGLSKQLYSSSIIQETLPLNHSFLWLNLTSGNPFMAILTFLSMWVLQKMSTQPTTDPQQQSMSTIMLWVMPLMFGFMSLTLPSGLALYWVVSNIISIVMQYRVTGWGTLKRPSLASLTSLAFLKGGAPQPANNPPAKTESAEESSTVEKDEKRTALQQGGATESGKSSGRKQIAGGDIISRRRKVGHGKHRGKRKN